MQKRHWSIVVAASLTIAGMGYVAPSFSHGADETAAAQPAAQRETAGKTAEQIVADWPEVAKKAAMETIKKQGQPTGITANRLIWQDKAPYKMIIAQKHQIPHHFPVEHFDVLEHVIDYMVPSDKFDELATFDGSVIVERTRGTMSARCDSEAHNLIALNLANDIVTGKTSVEDAKKRYMELAKALKQGEKPEYTQKLTFDVPKDTGDPGTPVKAQAAGQDQSPDKVAAKSDKNGQSDQNKPVLVGVVTVVPIAVTDPLLPQGATFVNEISDAADIRDSLAEITEAAFTKGGVNDIVERFVDLDRNRLGNIEELNHDTLDGRIAQLQKAWQEKYGQEFDIRENQVYAPLAFAQGQINDANAFMSQWPVDPTPMKSTDGAQTAGAAVQTDRVADEGNIEQGRDIAVVRLPEEFGLPVLNISMIDEAFGWKLDVPNTLQGQALQDRLLTCLTYIGENVDKWPADVNDAYRAATHHVLMAIYGIDMPSDKGAANGAAAK